MAQNWSDKSRALLKNDLLNLSFVKGINVVIKKLTRNGHKLPNLWFCLLFKFPEFRWSSELDCSQLCKQKTWFASKIYWLDDHSSNYFAPELISVLVNIVQICGVICLKPKNMNETSSNIGPILHCGTVINSL